MSQSDHEYCEICDPCFNLGRKVFSLEFIEARIVRPYNVTTDFEAGSSVTCTAPCHTSQIHIRVSTIIELFFSFAVIETSIFKLMQESRRAVTMMAVAVELTWGSKIL